MKAKGTHLLTPDHFLCCSDRKRIQDREETWQKLEQLAADNYANLTAQGAVTVPPPVHVEPLPVPVGNATRDYFLSSATRKGTIDLFDMLTV